MRLHPGETAATEWRVTPISDVIDHVLGAGLEGGSRRRPLVVGIDGRGGAGKSVLAGRLQRLVPRSAIVHTDDIAWNQSCFDWGGVLADNVLVPLREGRAVSFRPPAWAEHGRPGRIVVPAGLDVVWVEGTGIIRTELASLLDGSIYLQGDLDKQVRRLVERDGQDPETLEHVAAWLAEEIPFMETEKPWSHASILIDTTSNLPHAPHEVITAAPVALPKHLQL